MPKMADSYKEVGEGRGGKAERCASIDLADEVRILPR